MTVNYTTNLALGQPVTGTESGTWGDDVNNAVTAYLDIAIAGGLSIAITTADVTLANTQGTSSATNIGSTTAQYAILNITGAKTAARNLNVPASSRYYLINNSAATGGFLLTVRGVTPTTGITLVDGEKAIVAWNGTDYVKIVSTALSNSTGTLGAANGGTGVANNAASTLTISGSFATTLTVSGTTGITLPTTGTLATLAGSETFTNKTLTNPTVTSYVESVVAIGNSGTTQTLSLTNGTVQTVTMTGNCTFTMPTATAGKSFILIVSTGAGGFTGTFTSVKWPSNTAPTLTTTATRWDILTFFADGTNWYGTYAQAFQ